MIDEKNIQTGSTQNYEVVEETHDLQCSNNGEIVINEISQELPYEHAKPVKRFKKVKILCAVLASIALVVCGTINIWKLYENDWLTTSQVKNAILKSEKTAQWNVSDLKIVLSEPLKLPNADSNSDWKYVLCHCKFNEVPGYMQFGINTKNDYIETIYINHPFTYAFVSHIFRECDEQTNKNLFYKIKERIEKLGFTCFESQVTAADFLRFSTYSDGKIMPKEDAREIIKYELRTVYGNEAVDKWNQADEMHLLFENYNAFPKVIVWKTTELKYKWSYPEEYLDELDNYQIAEFKRVFGPAYVNETTYTARGINSLTGDLEKAYTFSSLDKVKRGYLAYSY